MKDYERRCIKQKRDSYLYGEAIDLKARIYSITVADNLIEHVTVHSQAAITVLVNDRDYPEGEESPNIIVTRNRIHNVRKSPNGWDGVGIWAAANGVEISNNLIWDTEESSIYSCKDAGNTQVQLKVLYNTCWQVISS
jgi:hypothetical protein